MRNLILIHLESLNYMNYHLNQHMFRNLSKWEKKSLSFHNYFSTATSTWMVIADLLYGGILQYETCISLEDIPKEYCYKESLLDNLNRRGYETKTLIYEDGGDYEQANERHIIGFQNKMKQVKGYKEYMNEIERTVQMDKPFALLLFNFFSNIACNSYIPGIQSKSGLERLKIGYEFMDAWVDDVMNLLEKKKVMENTIIVFYGDHGDDYYEHNNHNGLTHAIEPYANLIRTPLWIYDGRKLKPESYYDLINSTDIRVLIESFLQMPKGEQKWQLKMPVRKYSLARNSYAAQPVRSGSFNKGYSLTDGKFLFLVSNYGMEMYDIRIDLQCQNNLLNYFTYKDKILYSNEKNAQLTYHFTSFMDMGSFRQIRQNFYYFHRKIYQEVQELFRYAGCVEKMEELKFDKIHYL